MFSIAADFRILPNPSENVRACPEMKKNCQSQFLRIQHITDKKTDQYPGNTFFLPAYVFFRETCSRMIPDLV